MYNHKSMALSHLKIEFLHNKNCNGQYNFSRKAIQSEAKSQRGSRPIVIVLNASHLFL